MSCPGCPAVDNPAALRHHLADSGSSRIESYIVVLPYVDSGPLSTVAGSLAAGLHVGRRAGPIGPIRFDEPPSRGPSAHSSVAERWRSSHENTQEARGSSAQECAARTTGQPLAPPTATDRCTNCSNTSCPAGTPSTGRRRRSNSNSLEARSKRGSPALERVRDMTAC